MQIVFQVSVQLMCWNSVASYHLALCFVSLLLPTVTYALLTFWILSVTIAWKCQWHPRPMEVKEQVQVMGVTAPFGTLIFIMLEVQQFSGNRTTVTYVYTVFHKERNQNQMQPIWSFDNHKFKLHENWVNYCLLWLWNKCCWFLNCSLSISLICNVSNTSNEQAEITRNIWMKIALNLPKSFTQKLLVIQHNTFCRMFYNDCSKWPPFAATQEWRRRRHCLTVLSITRWSRRSHSSVIRNYWRRHLQRIFNAWHILK